MDFFTDGYNEVTLWNEVEDVSQLKATGKVWWNLDENSYYECWQRRNSLLRGTNTDTLGLVGAFFLGASHTLYFNDSSPHFLIVSFSSFSFRLSRF